MDFNASIILYRGIILVSKLYPSRRGHLMRSANGNPTELTKISTLFFNFSSRRPRTHGCRLDKFDTCLSEKPKLLKHHSFQPMFSFPTPNIAHIAYANPFLSPESSAYWHDSVIFSSKVVMGKQDCLAPDSNNSSNWIPNLCKSEIADLSLSSLELKIFESV